MRARNIKPGFFKNIHLAKLHPLARILYEGLWCMADREGRLHDEPEQIKAEILPYDKVNVDKLLDSLCEPKERFIVRYEVLGEKYICIPKFTEHQFPHVKERASTIPAPYKNSTSTGIKPDHVSPLVRACLNPESLNPYPESLNPESTCATPAALIDQAFLNIQKAIETETHKPIQSTSLLKLIGEYMDDGLPECAFKYAAEQMGIHSADYSYFQKIIETMHEAKVKTAEDLTRYKLEREQNKPKSGKPVQNNAASLAYIQREYKPGELDFLYVNLKDDGG